MEPTNEHYGTISGRYDELWSYSEGYLTEMTAQLAHHLDLQPEHRLGDVGGGTGLYARRLRDHVGLVQPVIVSDPSRGMLEALVGTEGFEVRCETAAEFAADGPVVDRLLLKEVVHHFEDLDASIAALAGRLAPEGRMLVAMLPPTIDYPLFGAALRLYEERQPHYDTVRAAMRGAGLDVDVTEITNDIHLSRDRYLKMVANRYMSLLSAFDDEQLAEGINEMRDQLREPELVVSDRMVLIIGTRDGA